MANYPSTTTTQFTGNIDLTDGGSVGIGTTSPAATFAVSNTGSGCVTQAIFGQGKTSGQSQVCIGQAATSNEAVSFGYDHGSNYGFMQVAGVSIGGSVVLASNGNVGIANTSPAQKLDVSGNIKTSGSLIVNGPTISSGAGNPNGLVIAPTGSIYLNTSGGAGTTLYVKESGVGNVGWVGK